jgi:hypothetical protein
LSLNEPITVESVVAELAKRGPEGAILAQWARERLMVTYAPLGDTRGGYATQRSALGPGRATIYRDNLTERALRWGIDPVAMAAEIASHEITHTNQTWGMNPTLEGEVEAAETQLRVFPESPTRRMLGWTSNAAIRSYLDGHGTYRTYDRGDTWFADEHQITNPVARQNIVIDPETGVSRMVDAPLGVTLSDNQAPNPTAWGYDSKGDFGPLELVRDANGVWAPRQHTEFSMADTVTDAPAYVEPGARVAFVKGSLNVAGGFVSAFGGFGIGMQIGDHLANGQYDQALVTTGAAVAFGEASSIYGTGPTMLVTAPIAMALDYHLNPETRAHINSEVDKVDQDMGRRLGPAWTESDSSAKRGMLGVVAASEAVDTTFTNFVTGFFHTIGRGIKGIWYAGEQGGAYQQSLPGSLKK